MRKQTNPYGKTKKRKAALAWLAARGITDPKPIYVTIPALPAVTYRKTGVIKLAVVS